MNPEAIQAEISRLQAQRHQAMARADVDVLDALLDDQLVYTHTDASRDHKGSYLEKVRTGIFRYVEVVSIEEDILVLNADTACVVGRMHLAGLVAGATRRLDNRFLAVWVRRADQWRLAAFQPTAVPTAAKS